MKKRIAKFISVIFHPAVFFILMPYLLLAKVVNPTVAWHWEIFSTAIVFIFIAVIALGVRKRIFSDDDVSLRAERYEFYYLSFLFALCYFFISLILHGIFFPLSIVSLALLVGVLAAEYCNRYMKISIHVGVACAFLCSLALLYGVQWLLLGILILPFLIWARVFLHEHTPKEIIVGAMIGAAITVATFYVGTVLV